MKKVLALSVLLACLPAFSLPLSKESKAEARALNAFLKSVYAQKNGDPKAFSYLQKALELSPESKYLKRQLVSESISIGKPEWGEPYLSFISEPGENGAEDWVVYAFFNWRTGNREEAQKGFENALAARSDDLQILQDYILFLSSSVDSQPTLLDLAQKYPEAAGVIYASLGQAALKNGRAQEALSFFNRAQKEDPSHPAPRLGRAELYERTNQYFLMLHELEELEKMGYGNASTYSRMGSVFLLVKDYPKAEEYFLKAKADDNGDAPSAYFLALLAENKGDYSRAVGYLRDAEDYAESASRQLQVSFYLTKLNRPEESLKTLEAAYRKFENNVEIGFFYGLALNDAKEYKKAAKVFENVLRTNPGYTDARLQYAYALESLKKYKDMERALETVLEKQPDNAAALNLYAYSLAQRGERLDEAQEYIARALAVNPEDNSFIDTQAWIYFKQGKLDEAADLLSTVPDDFALRDPEVAYHKGAVASAREDEPSARKYLEMAKDKNKAAAKLYKKLSSR